ncbi:MAG: Pyridoxine/pyridoxamine 5'-phosphate oxidase [bacterium ADurb.Bin429]|nr:MAG: Pyridoxine/pyridoxamine 5'-phosphate oxidase [bacterium ADurb.Bin429]
MQRDEIYAFLNANPICYLATIDGDRPRVRGMMLFKADADGLLFHSGGTKAMIHQIEANPHVEVCFFSQQDNVQVRVSGMAEFVVDIAVKQVMVAERPFLAPIVEKVGYAQFIVFRLMNCEAAVWTMENNMAPTAWVAL